MPLGRWSPPRHPRCSAGGDHLHHRIVEPRRHRLDRQVLRSIAGHRHLPGSCRLDDDAPVRCHEVCAAAAGPGHRGRGRLLVAVHDRHDTTPAVPTW